MRGRGRKRNSLVLAGKLVSRMNLLITLPTQRSLISTTQNLGLRSLTDVALNLHPIYPKPNSSFPPHTKSPYLSLLKHSLRKRVSHSTLYSSENNKIKVNQSLKKI